MASYNPQHFSEMNHNPDHVYFDMNMRSYDSPSTDDNIPLTFSDQRGVPIINKCSDYFLSVMRFQLDTFSDTIPIFMPQIQRDQASPTLTIYSVTLEYDDGVGGITTTQPEYLEWSPQKKNESIPLGPNAQPNGLQPFTPYYYCYNFSYWINIINAYLDSAMTKLKALVAPVLNTVESPFLVWNDDQTATLYARESHFDTDVFPQVRIYFNRPMYSLLSSLPSVKFRISNPRNKYYQLLMKRYNGHNVVTLPGFGIDQLIYSKQEYSTIDQWSPIDSILFVTTKIPIISNQLSSPKIYLDGNERKIGNTFQNFSNIITDISSGDLCYKPSLLYTPGSEYRLVDLETDQGLTSIDVSVMFKDKIGALHPVFIAPNSSASIKLLFRKKKLMV